MRFERLPSDVRRLVVSNILSYKEGRQSINEIGTAITCAVFQSLNIPLINRPKDDSVEAMKAIKMECEVYDMIHNLVDGGGFY